MRINRCLTLAVLLGVGGTGASAQYYEAISQATNMIQNALSGSMNYGGYVEFSGLAGIGENRANFIGVSTTHGFRYADWFYMGVGLGVDVAMSRVPDFYSSDYESFQGHSNKRTGVMLPVFSDFRFLFGGSMKFYVDVKAGASWLLGSRYLLLQDGYLTNNAQFYLKPTIGVRIPIGTPTSKNAFNIGITYQLLTSANNYYRGNCQSVSLSSLGLSVAYEW